MCDCGLASAGAAGPAAAARAALAALSTVRAARAAEVPAAELADCLRELERAESALTAARASVLGAFIAQDGQAEDGHGSARTWLAWQTRITQGAAAGAVGWARRLAAHPEIATGLAGGSLSGSWARQLCDWSDRLPADRRADADMILTCAARSGADLDGLAVLAEEMHRRCAPPDTDGKDFGDRKLVLDRTFGGAGRVTGDLSPQCAAALAAVLESLGAKAGPEDIRTQAQRDHDALEEACRRLLGAGCLPDRAGQPAQIRLHMTLDQLRGQPGADPAANGWAADESPAGPGYDCDAQIAPQVDGHVDPEALDQLTDTWITLHGLGGPDLADPDDPRQAAADPGGPDDPPDGPAHPGGAPDSRSSQLRPSAADARGAEPDTSAQHTQNGQPGNGAAQRRPAGAALTRPARPDAIPAGLARQRLAPATRARLRDSLLALAIQTLSGPAGLAAWLRSRQLAGAGGSPSLPLDVGSVTEIIPPHLRRAVTSRDKRCRFPGCRQRAAWCQVHHLVPRSRGGRTALTDLVLLCTFHHLIAVHRWGWQLTLHPDATITATSPDRTRVLHGQGPPPPRNGHAAAS